MIFSNPWAWLGLAALGALAAIYYLRQKARPRTVSSLLLWREEPPHREGGRRVERFEAPPLFWLELAAILLLVTAAAGPLLPTPESRRPLVMVLDDSFSMRAGGDDSPRAAAAEALAAELESSRHLTATVILAGERPGLLGSGAMESDRVTAALSGWRAAAPGAALAEAVSLASELGGPRARFLVLSDQPPPEEVADPRLAWWAFGRPRSNLAVVGAVRREGNCLLEIANYSGQPVTPQLRVSFGDDVSGSVQSMRLEASATGRVRFPVPEGQTIHAALGGDALAIDDAVVLLPETSRPVRVRNAVRDPRLRELMDETLLASGRAQVVTDRAELMVGDQASTVAGEAWSVLLVDGSQPKPYLGPFVLDHVHPLAEGLSLQGVIWAAGDPGAGLPAAAGETTVAGQPVVSAGDVPLVIDRERDDGGHDVVLRLDTGLSTLQQTPNWPILWWNLLSWRAASAPGLARSNFRLGETVTLKLERDAETIRWRRPGGGESVLPTAGGRVELAAEQLGIHELAGADGTQRFAVNALAADESDLRRAASGRWGGWDDAAGGMLWGYRPLAWLCQLLALGLLVLHLRWTR